MQLEIGTIVEGTVTGLTNFGAFVSLPDGKSGMVHISEVSTEFVKDIKDHLSEGQQVKVKIISIGDDGKIGLSIRKANEEDRPKRPQKPRGNRQPNVWQGQQKSNRKATKKCRLSKSPLIRDTACQDEETLTKNKRQNFFEHRQYSVGAFDRRVYFMYWIYIIIHTGLLLWQSCFFA